MRVGHDRFGVAAWVVDPMDSDYPSALRSARAWQAGWPGQPTDWVILMVHETGFTLTPAQWRALWKEFEGVATN